MLRFYCIHSLQHRVAVKRHREIEEREREKNKGSGVTTAMTVITGNDSTLFVVVGSVAANISEPAAIGRFATARSCCY